MNNSRKTLWFTLALCSTTMITVLFVQIKAENFLTSNCSYFDPVTIDLLAFLAALFLIFEGIYRILEHKKAPLKKQATRSIRIAFGCAIIALHLTQFFSKFGKIF